MSTNAQVTTEISEQLQRQAGVQASCVSVIGQLDAALPQATLLLGLLLLLPPPGCGSAA